MIKCYMLNFLSEIQSEAELFSCYHYHNKKSDRKAYMYDCKKWYYFQWKEEDVGKGDKVLVGRIGRHPY